MMRGVAGSGKTTRALALGVERVNRDTIRAELTGRRDKFRGDNKFEAKVSRIEQERVRAALIARRDVVVDATNLVLKHARTWANMANDYGHKFEVIDVRVPLPIALSQNSQREFGVPKEVVEKHYRTACWDEVVADAKHPFVDWSPVEYNPLLPDVVTCDIDGTLAKMPEGYSPYDPAHYPHNMVHRGVEDVLRAARSMGRPVYFLSGRDSAGREATEKWLGVWGIEYDGLYMRAEGDTRRDDVIKVELYNQHFRGRYNILYHLDDRQRVVDALRAIGLTVFQVAPGDF